MISPSMAFSVKEPHPGSPDGAKLAKASMREQEEEAFGGWTMPHSGTGSLTDRDSG